MRIINGGSKRRVYGAGRELDREMHAAFVQLEGKDGTVPSEAIYEVRRFRQKPWAYLARRISEAREADAPIEQVKEIVRVLDLYVDKLYNNSPRGAA